MNKYSTKIVNYLDENFNQPINDIDINKDLLKKILTICKEITSKTISYNPVSVDINSLHNDYNRPLIYQLYLPYYRNFGEFLNWYMINQFSNNLSVVNTSSKEYKDIFYPDNSRNHLHSLLYNNGFIGLDVIHYFEITPLTKVTVDNDIFNLTLYLPTMFKTRIDEYLSKIIKIIYLMNEINVKLINNKQQKLNVNVLLSLQRKEFTEFDTLTPMNVNSGSALRNVEVLVWREEELEKVLIHELLHYINCDFDAGCKEYKYVKDIVSSFFKVTGTDMVNESYNEIVANIINMCYQSCKLNIDLKKIYEYEIKFSLLQVAKIIKFYGGKNFKDIINININFKQTTSVLSYYVIKTYLLYNINETIDLVTNFDFKCDSDKITKYGDYLKKIISKINNDLTVEQYINMLMSKIDGLDNCFIRRTLRMTAIN